jgi:hypothetical protein
MNAAAVSVGVNMCETGSTVEAQLESFRKGLPLEMPHCRTAS